MVPYVFSKNIYHVIFSIRDCLRSHKEGRDSHIGYRRSNKDKEPERKANALRTMMRVLIVYRLQRIIT